MVGMRMMMMKRRIIETVLQPGRPLPQLKYLPVCPSMHNNDDEVALAYRADAG